jgi:hypothetical protein
MCKKEKAPVWHLWSLSQLLTPVPVFKDRFSVTVHLGILQLFSNMPRLPLPLGLQHPLPQNPKVSAFHYSVLGHHPPCRQVLLLLFSYKLLSPARHSSACLQSQHLGGWEAEGLKPLGQTNKKKILKIKKKKKTLVHLLLWSSSQMILASFFLWKS